MHKQKYYYVYILASRKNGTLYVGVTSNLLRRICEHKNHLVSGFTDQYNVTRLAYVEKFENIGDAIHREKRLKEWKRSWKVDLIEKTNPEWKDLYDELLMRGTVATSLPTDAMARLYQLFSFSRPAGLTELLSTITEPVAVSK